MNKILKLFLVPLVLLPLSAAAGDISFLENILHRGYGYEQIDLDSYEDTDLTYAKFIRLLPLIERSDPDLAEVVRLRLGSVIADDSYNDIAISAVTDFSDRPASATLSARSYVVQDMFSGELLFAKSPSERRAIASISKLFTAPTALRVFSDDQRFIMSSKAKVGGSTSDLVVGATFNLPEAITYLLIRSSNDVATQLQITYDELNYPGAFITAMNQTARLANLSNTSFADPSGLSPLNQSTALDLASYLIYLNNNYPELLAVSRQPLVKRHGNTLLSSNPMRQYTSFNLGGKNGYIDEARRTLASLVAKNNNRYVIVALGSDYGDNARDTKSLYDSI